MIERMNPMQPNISLGGPSAFPYTFWGAEESMVPGFIRYAPKKDFFQIIYISSGTGNLTQGQSLWPIGAGALIIVPPDPVSVLRTSGSSLRLLSFMIGGNCSRFPAVCHPFGLSETADELMKESLSLVPGSLFPQLDTLFSALSSGGYVRTREAKQLPEYICSLKEILDTRYSEPLNLDSIAQELHQNKFRLSREYKQYYGIPPIEFLLRRRIQEACLLLRETEITVTAIAEKVGINNVSYFIQVFRRQKDCSPLNYRKRFQKMGF